MVVAENDGSRGKAKRTMKKKQKTANKTQKADIGSKRKLAKFGKRQLSGRTGVAVHYVTRTKALKILQISLKDFRRLCILKGIYPRDPPKKPSGKQSTAYYASKDIAFLQHEPILNKFREMKAVAKKISKKLGKKEDSEAQRLFKNRPKYTLDHVVRERYPTFLSVLADLDDGLTLVNLFAHLPVSLASNEHGPRCSRIAREWQFYVAKTRSLRKTFVSIKGIYYQAEVRGQAITWMVPHKFSQDVQSLNANKEIDFRVMKTFLEFYETLLEFVMFKLYREELGANYPPTLLQDADQSGAFLKALRADPLAGSGKIIPSETASQEPLSKRARKSAKGTKGDDSKPSLEKVLADTAAKYQQTVKHARDHQKVLGVHESEDDEDDEEDVAGKEFANEDAEAKAVLENDRQAQQMTNLFRGLRIFLSREVPMDSCEFVIESFGGTTLREDLGDKPSDTTITHFVTDRPLTPETMLKSREYVQPQWLFDSANAKLLLPVDVYSPLVSALPPHLSPFVDDEAEGYKPARAQEIEDLKHTRAANGGTEAYLRATGTLKEEPTKATILDKEDDESTSSDEDEEEKEESDGEEDEAKDEDEVAPMEEDEEDEEDEALDTVKVKPLEPFIPSTTFKGVKPGFFFRRGAQGLGYYMDSVQPQSAVAQPIAKKFDAEKDAKQSIKDARKNESKEAKEMRTIMMSKKAKHLYERMQYGLNKKSEAVQSLEKKRSAIEKSSEIPSAKKVKPSGKA